MGPPESLFEDELGKPIGIKHKRKKKVSMTHYASTKVFVVNTI